MSGLYNMKSRKFWEEAGIQLAQKICRNATTSMKLMLVASIIVVAFLLIAPFGRAESAQPKRSHIVVNPDGSALGIEEQKTVEDAFDWQNSTPIDFLDHLKRYQVQSPFYSVVGFHKDWIREEDIPALIRLFDSKEPCRSVVSAYSSFIPPKSTVGQEAAYMVYGFFFGRYPASWHSQAVDKKNLLMKWEEYWKKK